MEIPRLVIKGVDSLAEEFHLHIVAPTVVIIPGMKRLMQVANKVDEILECFLPFLIVGSRIGEGFSKPLNLTDHTLIVWTHARGFILRILQRNVHVMPRRSLFVTDLVCPNGCLDKRGSFQEFVYPVSNVSLKPLL